MKSKNFTKKFLVLLVFALISFGELHAQWSGAYGNEWLAGKYNQPWVSIKAGAIPGSNNTYTRSKGIYRIAMNSAALPSSIKNADKSLLQLYHRGRQVDIIKADNTEILFYAVPNDGKSDELFYRPTSSRVNPYWSAYSDESTYFLTVGAEAGARAASVQLNNPGATVLDAHVKTDLKTFQNDYSHAAYSPMRPPNINSFFEDGKTKTGASLYDDGNPTWTKNGATGAEFSVQVTNKSGSGNPQIKGLIHGRSYFPSFGGSRVIKVYIGKTAATLREATQVSIPGFYFAEFTIDVQPDDLDANGKAVLGFTTLGNSENVGGTTVYDSFSVTYYQVTYSQTLNMQNAAAAEFVFPGAATGTVNKVSISNVPAGASFYDISDPDKPRKVIGATDNLQFSRINDSQLTLLATNQTPYTVTDAKIASISFSNINPADFNYLIVTNKTLEAAADEFKEYRTNGSPGEKYKAGVFKIIDIYNQFNYGEPSPVAIRRFVDYMISNGDRQKYLLLMGPSIARNDRAVREMPDEVPTVGYPSSDVLLVEGLGGELEDVPAIPVGRIPAVSYDLAHGYLEKVKTYESANVDLAWRRKVIHVSGGKSSAEINLHAGNLATAATASGITTQFSGVVSEYKKPAAQAGTIPVTLDITSQVNAGVGMITYFGHSAPYQTDYNFGYVSDAAKGYTATNGKYPVIYYNGCDILNIFSNNIGSTSVNSSSSRPQSVDWLLTPDRGAIAVFGNSFSGYNESCNEFLQELYPLIFGTPDKARQTLGNILRATSHETKSNPNPYRMSADNARIAADYQKRRAQLHQTVLIGDPAIQILFSTEGGLPVDLSYFNAKAVGESSVEVTWKTASEKNNSHFIIERSYNAKNFEVVGLVEGKGDTDSPSSYVWYDNKPLSGKSYYRLVQTDRSTVENGQNVDGKKTTSQIVPVDRPFSSALIISPNPATDQAEIKLDLPVSMKSWKLIDLNGKVRRKGLTSNQINTSDLPSGEYVLEVTTTAEDTYSKKLIKK
ncbi:C25 family cysteine peptidase [Dyadobacter sp. Leaf189]|uniref:putative type IX secretion system sortase PorU2 n=1 Tax=Dyadobacter sp. Leaf189 TaxID=1736295 RepID=UPI0006F4BE36|nr:C25 family cysteine peptidase [Dyadobacter sp. Leaf189]KQS33225.1 hypothetical protein ASG33_03840 [Dyadobacter sp. Leaf189]